ncbi:DUF6079 family protein [Arthrobacter sp. Marseille-P9274]|uniref:DUF6079 family protein n=1 Tax=Arthrobacter sp. Marseille-P9274 TaxID=2866572 RepID=UPI0021C8DC04|nr:DUF6079 family protein [Arthrobacter sp. Marseille-P9274]
MNGVDAMMLKDALDIPERVDASDFVLQLHNGVEAADRTIGEYVITDSLARSFDEALGLVGRTLADGRSKGAFVHGSFGSGKSHFMAVLHLLLAGNTRARQLKNLQAAVAKHEATLQKKLLAVDYHLLGAESFESALFKGYLDTVARERPDAAPAVLHQSSRLFEDAVETREILGDDAFFKKLNEASSSSSGWGAFAAAWDSATFDAAIREPVAGGERTRLVQALTSTMFRSYTKTGDWLDITDGLQAMTLHAQGLGYEGVILFLDELVLWLAQHLGDTSFIQSETSKVAKLVETGASSLALPLVSFVARQRDLKDFLGGTAIGAEREAIGQSFQWWEDRFEAITLEAADLPRIVHQRLLQPKTDDGRQALSAATASVKSNPGAMRHLLADEAGSNETDFELVYPFSPALIDALVALSAIMQRERTALKILGELLSAGRDELRVTDVVPVGDVFELIVLGQAKPLTSDMKKRFEIAATFYMQKMRPYLLRKHGLEESSTHGLSRDHVFRTEDRLARTLLVAEIAPGAVSLQNLTAAKLAALNFGTIRSFIPGQESQTVLQHVRDWAKEFGEVTLEGSTADPVISVSLTGVDSDAIVERVQGEDTPNARRTLIRSLISASLGIPEAVGLMSHREHTLVWRGQKITVDVIFGNIRDTAEVPDDALRADGNRWKVVIDYPFDSEDHGAQEDLNRLAKLRDGGLDSKTLAWVPHFLTAARMNDVGQLVLLEHLLKGSGEQFEQNATGLAPADRPLARRQLESQRTNLRSRLQEALRQAYGVDTAKKDDVDVVIQVNEVFSTLVPGLNIHPPVAADLKNALNKALAQGQDELYPKHPKFEPSETEVRKADLATVVDLAEKAISAGGRIEGIDRSKAAVLHRVAAPLQLGEPRESVYSLSAANFGWREGFTRWTAGATSDVYIRDLRDELEVFGMTREVEDVLILVWSMLEDRQWLRASAPLVAVPAVGSLTDDMALRVPELPAEEDWAIASKRAQSLFGVQGEPRLSTQSVLRTARAVREKARTLMDPSKRLVGALHLHKEILGIPDDSSRFVTAKRAAELAGALSAEADDALLITVLAEFDLPQEPEAFVKSLVTSSQVLAALEGADWNVLEKLHSMESSSAANVRQTLAEGAKAEELHIQLAPRLKKAKEDALSLILGTSRRPQPPKQPDTGGQEPLGPTPPVDGYGAETVDEIELTIDVDNLQSDFQALQNRVQQTLTNNPGKKLRIKWWLE